MVQAFFETSSFKQVNEEKKSCYLETAAIQTYCSFLEHESADCLIRSTVSEPDRVQERQQQTNTTPSSGAIRPRNPHCHLLPAEACDLRSCVTRPGGRLCRCIPRRSPAAVDPDDPGGAGEQRTVPGAVWDVPLEMHVRRHIRHEMVWGAVGVNAGGV